MSSSFASDCTEAKKKYDECFNNWYDKQFLQGKGIEDDCSEIWIKYKQCIEKSLKKNNLKEMIEKARKEYPFTSENIKMDVRNVDEKKKRSN